MLSSSSSAEERSSDGRNSISSGGISSIGMSDGREQYGREGQEDRRRAPLNEHLPRRKEQSFVQGLDREIGAVSRHSNADRAWNLPKSMGDMINDMEDEEDGSPVEDSSVTPKGRATGGSLILKNMPGARAGAGGPVPPLQMTRPFQSANVPDEPPLLTPGTLRLDSASGPNRRQQQSAAQTAQDSLRGSARGGSKEMPVTPSSRAGSHAHSGAPPPLIFSLGAPVPQSSAPPTSAAAPISMSEIGLPTNEDLGAQASPSLGLGGGVPKRPLKGSLPPLAMEKTRKADEKDAALMDSARGLGSARGTGPRQTITKDVPLMRGGPVKPPHHHLTPRGAMVVGGPRRLPQPGSVPSFYGDVVNTEVPQTQELLFGGAGGTSAPSGASPRHPPGGTPRTGPVGSIENLQVVSPRFSKTPFGGSSAHTGGSIPPLGELPQGPTSAQDSPRSQQPAKQRPTDNSVYFAKMNARRLYQLDPEARLVFLRLLFNVLLTPSGFFDRRYFGLTSDVFENIPEILQRHLQSKKGGGGILEALFSRELPESSKPEILPRPAAEEAGEAGGAAGAADGTRCDDNADPSSVDDPCKRRDFEEFHPRLRRELEFTFCTGRSAWSSPLMSCGNIVQKFSVGTTRFLKLLLAKKLHSGDEVLDLQPREQYKSDEFGRDMVHINTKGVYSVCYKVRNPYLVVPLPTSPEQQPETAMDSDRASVVAQQKPQKESSEAESWRDPDFKFLKVAKAPTQDHESVNRKPLLDIFTEIYCLDVARMAGNGRDWTARMINYGVFSDAPSRPMEGNAGLFWTTYESYRQHAKEYREGLIGSIYPSLKEKEDRAGLQPKTVPNLFAVYAQMLEAVSFLQVGFSVRGSKG